MSEGDYIHLRKGVKDWLVFNGGFVSSGCFLFFFFGGGSFVFFNFFYSVLLLVCCVIHIVLFQNGSMIYVAGGQ